MADFFSFYNRLNEKKELDPVKDKALDKKFKNRKDKDIDNDGDVDSSDEYLHKRRKKIDKAMDEGSCSKKRVSEATAKELKKLDLGDDVMVNGKMGMFYGMEGRNLVKVRTREGTNLYDVKDVEIMNLMMDELEKDEDDPCWDGYVQVGTKMKNGKEVPKCVPMEEAKSYMKEEVSKLLGEAKVTDNHWAIVKQNGSFYSGKSEIKKIVNPTPRGNAPSMKMINTYGGDTAVKVGELKKKLKGMRNTDKLMKQLNEAYDYPDYGPTGAAEMAMTQLHFIQYAAEEVIGCLKAGTEMPEWYQNKIAKVEGDMEGIHSYMEGKRRKREMCGPENMGMDDYDYDMDIDTDADMDMDMDMDDDEEMMGTGMFESKQISEKLSATDDISDWIKDFKDSDAEQFKGKSDEERKDMAIAAYYDARKEAGYKTPQQKDD